MHELITCISEQSKIADQASTIRPNQIQRHLIQVRYLLSFLESVPGVESKLKTPLTGDRKFEDVVKDAQAATVLVY